MLFDPLVLGAIEEGEGAVGHLAGGDACSIAAVGRQGGACGAGVELVGAARCVQTTDMPMPPAFAYGGCGCLFTLHAFHYLFCSCLRIFHAGFSDK